MASTAASKAHGESAPRLSTDPLTRADANRLADLLKVVSDPTRLQLLSLIAGAERGEACVADLVEPLGLRQPTISHHLKRMVEAGLLVRTRRGSYSWYSIVPERLGAIADIIR